MRNIRLTQDLKEQEFVHQNEMMQVKLKLAQMQRVYCSDAERNEKRNGGTHMRMRSLDISIDEAGERVFDNVAEEFDDSQFEMLDHLNAKLEKAEKANIQYREQELENARKLAKLEN